jgi:hypothetical protein
MIKTIIAIAITATMSASYANQWTGKDKTQHAIVGAAIGSATTLATGNWMHGCAAATAIGVAKEVYDNQNRDRHTSSAKDAVVTALAGCLAAKGTSLVIVPTRTGAMLSYKFTF